MFPQDPTLPPGGGPSPGPPPGDALFAGPGGQLAGQGDLLKTLAAELAQSSLALVNYTVKLDDEALRRWGVYLRREIDQYQADTQTRRSLAEQWRRDYEMMNAPGFRWSNCAEVCSPFTHLYCSNHAMRLDTQIAQTDPPISVIARKAEAVEQAPQIEEAVAAALEEADWRGVASQVHSELAILGNCFVRLTYEENIVRHPEPTAEWDEALFQQALGAGMEPEEAFRSAVKRGRDGLPIIGLRWVEDKRSAGPVFKAIPWEDGLVIPAAVRNPEDARGMGERLMICGEELRTGVDRGTYFRDAVEVVLSRPSDPVTGDRADRLDQQGLDPSPETEPAEGGEDPAFRWYECYELAYRADWNHDGELEWALVTFHYASSTILRLAYLPYEHGRPCYFLMRYMERTQELWGMSVSELVAVIQDADTALLNQLIDSGDLALNTRGNFFYEKSSGFDPAKWVFEMARPIPVESTQGILPMSVGPLSPEHYQLHQVFKDMADLLTSTSNPSLGKETDTQKTLGEVKLVLGASNLVFEGIAAGVALQWAELLDQFRLILAQFGQDGQVQYRKSAAPGALIAGPGGQPQPAAEMGGQMVPAPGGVAFGTIPADVLRADVDLVPTGLSQMGDANARLQQAMLVLNTLGANPLTAQNTPVQVIALDTFLQAVRYPPREKIMDEVEKDIAAKQAVMAMEQQAAAQAALAGGMMAGSQEGAAPPPGGGPPPGPPPGPPSGPPAGAGAPPPPLPVA